MLRYKRHFFMATGINAQSVAQEFLQHANDEQLHADQIAQRIVQLGGEPDFSPDTLTRRSHAAYDESQDLKAMLKANLVAERVAIDSYRDMINYFSNDDPTTRRLMELSSPWRNIMMISLSLLGGRCVGWLTFPHSSRIQYNRYLGNVAHGSGEYAHKGQDITGTLLFSMTQGRNIRRVPMTFGHETWYACLRSSSVRTGVIPALRAFDLDEEYLEGPEGRNHRAKSWRSTGRTVFVWTGDCLASVPCRPKRVPLAYTPRHLAEKILTRGRRSPASANRSGALL